MDRLLQSLENQERVAIYADFDLDGTSGAALLKTGLEYFGFKDLVVYQPKRLAEGYGVHPPAIDALKSQNISVIVTVDVGITAFSAATRAIELGIDMVVTDHHSPLEELPLAHTIVNPNCRDCTSGLGHLSGAGVAFYLVLALRKVATSRGIQFAKFDPKELLDAFVIGTLTDMVPLKDENRVLVKHGLLQLAKTKRVGLRKLIHRVMGDRAIGSQDVGFSIAPKLNALSRLEQGITPIEIFLLEDSQRADGLVESILNQNEFRRDIQAFAVEKALKILAIDSPLVGDPSNSDGVDSAKLGESAKSDNVEKLSPVSWVWSEEFHKGVIGLVATQVARQLGQPAFVGALDAEGIISGSARLPDGDSRSLVAALEFSSEHLIQFGGHPQAAGFRLKVENAENFRNDLASYFVKNSSNSFIATDFDIEVDLTELTGDFAKWLGILEPFGKAFPTPRFLIRDAKIVKIKEMKGGHLRFTLESSKGETIGKQPVDGWTAVAFSPSDGVKRLGIGEMPSLVVEPQINHFNGASGLQLRVIALSE